MDCDRDFDEVYQELPALVEVMQPGFDVVSVLTTNRSFSVIAVRQHEWHDLCHVVHLRSSKPGTTVLE